MVHMKSINNPAGPLTLQIPLSPTIPPSLNDSLSNFFRTLLSNNSQPDQLLNSPVTELFVSQTPSQILSGVVLPLNSTATHVPPQPEMPYLSLALHMVTEAQNGSTKPKQPFYVSYINPDFSEPSCYSKAIKHEHWYHVMVDKYNALIPNGTWQFVPTSLIKYYWLSMGA
ncbi:hypothetical protein FXO38_36750 [Capsicum annuum]|nr:hypothetical protein FXO38_36750 [Capsicum annuum]